MYCGIIFKRLSTILFLLNICSCYPIEVTGKNIKYYQLTPNEGSGSYKFKYGTNDGAQRSERGYIKPDIANPTNKLGLLVVSGSYKDAHGDDVYYIADEQGYRIVSKEEIDELHSKMPDIPFQKGEDIKVDLQTLANKEERTRKQNDEKIISNDIVPNLPSSENFQSRNEDSIPNATTKRQKQSSRYPIPVTESQLIKVNIIQPIKLEPITCAPGQCNGARESKVFKIKSLKFG